MNLCNRFWLIHHHQYPQMDYLPKLVLCIYPDDHTDYNMMHHDSVLLESAKMNPDDANNHFQDDKRCLNQVMSKPHQDPD